MRTQTTGRRAVMTKKTMTISVDEKLKDEFQAACEAAHMTVSGAIQQYMASVLRNGSFDFHIPIKSYYEYAAVATDGAQPEND